MATNGRTLVSGQSLTTEIVSLRISCFPFFSRSLKAASTPRPQRGSLLFDALLARQSVVDADAGPFVGLTDNMFTEDRDKFVQAFSNRRCEQQDRNDPWTPRTDLLRAALLSTKRPGLKERLFDFNDARHQRIRGGMIFTLDSPNSKFSDIPLQHHHSGPLAIPYSVANQIYPQPDILLDNLNEILGTTYDLSRPGLAACLQEFLDARCDFGQIYGRLRPWWFIGNFERMSTLMYNRKEQDAALRQNAIVGHCIIEPRMPPRRVWDLYSNRVLPFHALRVEDPLTVPDSVWAVSHSWQGEKQRPRITRINDEAWPVPLPEGVELGDVRIELLNMGAEYVFLDVLCLRQVGNSKEKSRQELRRLREWRLDVPTIGYVYQNARTTVVYFNGLGLPLKTDKDVFESKYHWFNRVWTLQETSTCWLPGGLASTLFAQPKTQPKDASKNVSFLQDPRASVTVTLHRRLGALTDITRSSDLFAIIDTMLKRQSSSPRDQVFGLIYLLQCTTLPTYDTGDDVEDAWEALVQNMSSLQRLAILVGWGSAGEGFYTWRPSWKQLASYHSKRSESPITLTFALRFQHDPKFSDYEHLQYLPDDGLGYHDGSDAFYHYGYVIEWCSITRQRAGKTGGRWGILRREMRQGNIPLLADQSAPRSGATSPSEWEIVIWSGPLQQQKRVVLNRFLISRFRKPYIDTAGDDYILVGLANFRCWIVGRKPEINEHKPGNRRGVRRVGKNGERAIELEKVCMLEVSDAVSRDIQALNPGMAEKMVVYC